MGSDVLPGFDPTPEPEQVDDSRSDLIRRLQALCDDEWLRERDRHMELPGSRYWRPDAAGAIERAAHEIRRLIENDPAYDPRGSGGAYLDWMRSGRDKGQENAS